MNLNELISNIDWLPVIFLVIASFIIGFLWHQPFLFGKTWKKENNYSDEIKAKINAPLIFGGTALMHFIAITGLSAVASGSGAVNGLLVGLLISIVWVLPALAGTYLFANRSLKLLAIDAGNYIVLFSICGLVLGIW